MKKIILLVFLTCLSNSIFGQNAFYDAQFLTTISPTDLGNILLATDNTHADLKKAKIPALILSETELSTLKDYILFLNNPFDPKIKYLDQNALISSIHKYNKYIESVSQAFNSGYRTMAFVPGLATALPLISSIAGGSFSLSAEQQTKIIDGLTKYYAEEFRKAQLLTYMQTFENTIDKIGELQVLFPQTYAKLKSADPARFPELGDEYKSIFNEDLKSLTTNLIAHIEDSIESNQKNHLDSTLKWLTVANKKKIRANKYYESFKVSADVGSKLINNYHPVDLFNFIDNKYYDTTVLTKETEKMTQTDYLKVIFHGLNLIQRNLLDTTKKADTQFSNIWLSTQDFRQLDTKQEWLYFTGLIYQQDKAFFDTFIFEATGKNITESTIANLSKNITSILSALVELQNFRAAQKQDLNDSFSKYMNLVLKTVEITYYTTPNRSNLSNAELKKHLQIANYTLAIYDNVRQKDYNNTIYYTMEILNQLLEGKQNYIEVINTIEQYASFMTDIINADDSDAVKNIIKKHAAPPTSFILKREYRQTISITGQPGYFASIEKFDGSNQNFGFVSGITLPIGFEMTFKIKHGKANSGSIGIFAQLVDLGAVLNFRTGDSTSTLPDKIEFQQLFSPGGSINYGFKNSPLVIGIGYQYTPQLRSITDNGNLIYPNGHRVFLRLAWDIPLVNICKSKTK